VVESASKSFCGGIELGEYTPRRVFQLLDAFHNAFIAMMDTAKPVLVVVNGPAFGGGSELRGACRSRRCDAARAIRAA
jgi:enoyl-CoA hydratase/carnithine racemase